MRENDEERPSATFYVYYGYYTDKYYRILQIIIQPCLTFSLIYAYVRNRNKNN